MADGLHVILCHLFLYTCHLSFSHKWEILVPFVLFSDLRCCAVCKSCILSATIGLLMFAVPTLILFLLLSGPVIKLVCFFTSVLGLESLCELFFCLLLFVV